MNDDWVSFIMVTTLLLAMIYLCTYLQNMAIARKDWVNLKCNPLYMLIDSLSSESSASVANFKNCVNNV